MNTRLILFLSLATAAFTLPITAQQPADPDPEAMPWGIATSASSTRTVADWFPTLSDADVVWVRAFAEWGTLEPVQGTLNFAPTDALLDVAQANHLQLSGLIFGSPKWAAPSSHPFAMDHLDAWGNYANALATHYKDHIRYWEVWNEGNSGFNDGHNTAADYARLVSAAYQGAKKADPNAQIGLSVASFDAPYIGQVVLAQATNGKPEQFDYICLHPYETLGGLSHPDGEILYLWMTKILRDELKATDPERVNIPVWITEISRHIDDKSGAAIRAGEGSPEEEAARALVKAYIMALAQGISRICWFEAKDPVGEEAGFGLIRRDDTPRPSYIAMKMMIGALGETPKYLGWLALDKEQRSYGFLFQGRSGPVLVPWMPAGESDRSITFSSDVKIVDPLTGNSTSLLAGQPLSLGSAPVFISGVPSDLVAQAHAHASKPFPWGGNYSTTSTVSLEFGTTPKANGIFHLISKALPIHAFDDGSSGMIVEGDYTHSVVFYTHPSFANVMTREYYVRLTYRRITSGNVGWNFHYEVADSHAKGPMGSNGGWYSAGPDMGWQTHTWHVTDASFSKMWGYDFSFNPEKSVPFVIGKVEVSTRPF